MAFIGKTFDAQLVSAGDDGALYRMLSMKTDLIQPSGSSALFSISDNTLTISECYVLVCGRFFRIADGTTISLGTIPSTHGKGRVIVRLDMTELASESTLAQIETEVETQISNYAYRTLVQDDINSIDGQSHATYEAVLCSFTCTSGTASNPVSVLGAISGKDLTERTSLYNSSVASQFLSVLQTYYNNRSSLTYLNQTALNVTMGTSGGKYGIDCSTFVLLGLKGVQYSGSRYANGGDRDNNVNSYSWGMDIFSGRSKNISGVSEYSRYAVDVARYFWEQGLIYKHNTDWSNAKPGDIMFWVDASDVGNDDIQATLSGVHHCAVFTGLDGSGNVQYIDANTNRTNVVDTNTQATTSSSLAQVLYLGALPFEYAFADSKDIRARAYLNENASLTNTNYAILGLDTLEGSNQTDYFALANGKLSVKKSGYYSVSIQYKVNTSTNFVQTRSSIYNASGTLIEDITEDNVFAVKDIGGTAHNGYNKTSYVRYMEAGQSIALRTAGAGTFMKGRLGCYLEIVKL